MNEDRAERFGADWVKVLNPTATTHRKALESKSGKSKPTLTEQLSQILNRK